MAIETRERVNAGHGLAAGAYDVERIREALASGADEYIMKPFDGDILVAKFAEVGLV